MTKFVRAEWANPEQTLVLIVDNKDGRYIGLPTDPRLYGLIVAPFPAAAKPPVPPTITRLQAFTVMRDTIRESGKSLYTEALEKLQASVAATASLPESDERRRAADLAMLAFTTAGTFERNNPLIEQIGLLLDLDGEQLDQLFIRAVGAETQGGEP